jgi:hypothetical protein
MKIEGIAREFSLERRPVARQSVSAGDRRHDEQEYTDADDDNDQRLGAH